MFPIWRRPEPASPTPERAGPIERLADWLTRPAAVTAGGPDIWAVYATVTAVEGGGQPDEMGRSGPQRSVGRKAIPRWRRCTWCSGQRLKPTEYRGSEVLFALVLCRPYRCDHCKDRFIRPLFG